MAKQVPQYDYEHNLEPDLLRFLTRIEDLEQKAKEENSNIHIRELEWDTHISEITREINFFKSQLQDIRNRLEDFKEKFMSSVADFKLKADMDELRKLESKIDHLNLENLMTKAEFLRKSGLK